ncbi:MFS transporter [Brevibacillus ginsengisoli]|uniref:MFS transporter n=1 Tax=Brevibacillus ginsengisoli TaxID=363854 RepID=UPI003CF7CA5F
MVPSLWKNRSFVALWLAQVASNIGDQFYSIALLWYLLQQTHSASLLSLIAIPDMVAGFLFYLVGGVLADRYSPRMLMMGADLARLVLVALVGSLVLLQFNSLLFFLAIQFLVGIFSTLFHPSKTVALKSLIAPEHLQQANAILDTTFRTVRIAAPMTIGVLAAFLPLYLLFYFNAITYILSALCIYYMKLTHERDQALSSVKGFSPGQYMNDIRSAATEVLTNRYLLYVLIFSNMGFLVWQVCWSVGFPVLANQLGHGDAGFLGILIGFYGVGNLLGSLFMTRFRYQNHLLVMLVGWLFQAVGFMSISFFSNHLYMVYLGASVAGLGGPLIGIPSVTAIQSYVSNQNIGKVFALNMLVFTLFGVLSSSMGALWLGKWPVELMFGVSGLYLLLSIVVSYFLGRQVWRKKQAQSYFSSGI